MFEKENQAIFAYVSDIWWKYHNNKYRRYKKQQKIWIEAKRWNLESINHIFCSALLPKSPICSSSISLIIYLSQFSVSNKFVRDSLLGIWYERYCKNLKFTRWDTFNTNSDANKVYEIRCHQSTPKYKYDDIYLRRKKTWHIWSGFLTMILDFFFLMKSAS